MFHISRSISLSTFHCFCLLKELDTRKMKVHFSIQRQERSSSSSSTLPPIRFNPCILIGMKSLIISVSSLCLIFQTVVCSSSHNFQSSLHQDTKQTGSHSIKNDPSSPIWPDGLYTQSSYYYPDYKTPPPKHKFIPDPPSCPETGRTVCQEVEKYPS